MRPLPRLALATLALLALGGCGSSHRTEGSGSTSGSETGVVNAPYERALNTWLDKPEESLVAAWGVPERSQRLTDGGQALEYRRANNGNLLCTTLFTSDVYGMIRTWAYRGAECRPPKLGDYGGNS